MCKAVIALDPSGNFNEGKGTTGYCVSRDGFIFKTGQIYSAEYKTQMEYWDAVIELIAKIAEQYDDIHVVCEDYRLYASASEAQINSNLETPQLIGAIKYFCFLNNIEITLQMASEVKQRWSNEILLKKGIIGKGEHGKYRIGMLPLEHHSIDALRHCMHYNTFKDKTRLDRKVYRASRNFSTSNY